MLLRVSLGHHIRKLLACLARCLRRGGVHGRRASCARHAATAPALQVSELPVVAMDGLIDVAARMFHVDIVLYKICSRSLRKAFPALGSHAFLASALHIHVLESKVTVPLAANHASCYHTVTLCLPRLAVSRPQEACFEVLDTRRLCAALHLRPLRETGMLQTTGCPVSHISLGGQGTVLPDAWRSACAYVDVEHRGICHAALPFLPLHT